MLNEARVSKSSVDKEFIEMRAILSQKMQFYDDFEKFKEESQAKISH
jgi:hypothetical protein